MQSVTDYNALEDGATAVALSGLKQRAAERIWAFLRYWASQKYRDLPGVHPSAHIDDGVIVMPGVTVGRLSYINGPSTLIQSGTIGSFCSIAWGVTIGPDEHPVGGVSTHPFWYNPKHWLGNSPDVPLWSQPKSPPVIGNDVWIGCNAVIRRGAVIEDGAVVGANAVVSGHVPAFAVVAGSPARVLRYRFEEPVRKAISASCWWEWSEDRLRDSYNLFADPGHFGLHTNSGD